MNELLNNHPEEYTFHEYLDDEMSSFERRNFKIHLSSCQKCSNNLAILEQLFVQIEEYSPIEFTKDISSVVIREINHFIQIEPIVKRTTWLQIGIILILFAASFSSVSIEIFQSRLSAILNNLGTSVAMNASVIADFFLSLPGQITNLEVHIPRTQDLLSINYLSINFLLSITVILSFLWFIGNRFLLPNSLISHSKNGG
jgi:hypothetical protein